MYDDSDSSIIVIIVINIAGNVNKFVVFIILNGNDVCPNNIVHRQ